MCLVDHGLTPALIFTFVVEQLDDDGRALDRVKDAADVELVKQLRATVAGM